MTKRPEQKCTCAACGAVNETSHCPTLAAVLSGIVPGLGQFYRRRMRKGFLMLGLAMTGFILTATVIGAVFGIPLLIANWVWSVQDAYTEGSEEDRETRADGT